MPSAHYSSMKATINKLRRHLLPSKFNPEGNYRQKDFTGVIAFRVLCHAAFEEYLEERVIQIAVAADKACQQNGTVSWPATCLVAFSGLALGAPPDSLDAPQVTQVGDWPSKVDVKVRVKSCTSSFVRRVKVENHGVLERNVLSLLLPVGYSHSSINRLLLQELESFGRSRGEYAHRSASTHIQSRPNPEDELNKVTNILELLLEVDRDLAQLLRSIRV